MTIEKVTPQQGQESVWDYPRPPRLEPVPNRLRVIFEGEVIADTTNGYRVLETSHPPVYYIPMRDIQRNRLRREAGCSQCEWKGEAGYWSVEVNGRVSQNAAWSYEHPKPGFQAIQGYLAFYPDRVDECYVDDERVTPQPGGFYGGWITKRITGPFKGGPGTSGW